MYKFKSSLAHNIFNFAIRIEKISKSHLTRGSLEEVETLAKLQGSIELNLKQMLDDTRSAEEIIKKLKEH